MARVDYNKLNDLSIPRTFLQENALLGALIQSPFYISEARKMIDLSCFESEPNRKLWNTLCEMDAKGEEIELSSIYTKADTDNFQKNILPNCKDQSLISLSNMVSDLKVASVRRSAFFSAYALLQAATSDKDVEEMIQISSDFIKGAEASMRADDSRKISTILTELGDVLEKRESDRINGKRLRIPTSLVTLDWMTYGGFSSGNLVILAARPSVGKTAIALQMARHAALSGSSALFFSLEMTNIELAQRMLTSTKLISTMDMVKGDVDWSAFEKATGKFYDVPLWFNDKATTVDEIIQKISTAHRKGNCDIAFIDYLGLMRSNDSNKSLYQQITETTRRLKIAAKESEIPIVLLCQLNRESVSGGKKHPDLHDLRDSGSIEQDADIVLMLERNENMGVTMWVRKNRQGKAGDPIDLLPDDTYTNFVETTNLQ